jgi:hypothetical protein
MSIVLTNKSQKFIFKNNINNLFIDLTYIEELCAQIYDPKIRVIEKKDLEKFEDYDNISIDNLTLYISTAFTKIYGKLDKYLLDTGGIVKKSLVLKNVDSIIRNICKPK